jgi:excisionase family DNA binding protein
MNVRLLTLREAAERLRLSTDQLRAFVHDGELRYINLGRGRKRPRMKFTEFDLAEFVTRRTRRDVECQSTSRSERRTTLTTSRSEVIGFTARLNAERDGKLKNLKR